MNLYQLIFISLKHLLLLHVLNVVSGSVKLLRRLTFNFFSVKLLPRKTIISYSSITCDKPLRVANLLCRPASSFTCSKPLVLNFVL